MPSFMYAGSVSFSSCYNRFINRVSSAFTLFTLFSRFFFFEIANIIINKSDTRCLKALQATQFIFVNRFFFSSNVPIIGWCKLAAAVINKGIGYMNYDNITHNSNAVCSTPASAYIFIKLMYSKQFIERLLTLQIFGCRKVWPIAKQFLAFAEAMQKWREISTHSAFCWFYWKDLIWYGSGILDFNVVLLASLSTNYEPIEYSDSLTEWLTEWFQSLSYIFNSEIEFFDRNSNRPNLNITYKYPTIRKSTLLRFSFAMVCIWSITVSAGCAQIRCISHVDGCAWVFVWWWKGCNSTETTNNMENFHLNDTNGKAYNSYRKTIYFLLFFNTSVKRRNCLHMCFINKFYLVLGIPFNFHLHFISLSR